MFWAATGRTAFLSNSYRLHSVLSTFVLSSNFDKIFQIVWELKQSAAKLSYNLSYYMPFYDRVYGLESYMENYNNENGLQRTVVQYFF